MRTTESETILTSAHKRRTPASAGASRLAMHVRIDDEGTSETAEKLHMSRS